MQAHTARNMAKLSVLLLLAALLQLDGASAVFKDKGEHPTGSWVVQINGDDAMAEKIAQRDGFRNRGKVSSISYTAVIIIN